MAAPQKAKISDLILDDKNFNKGTDYGNGLIEKSLSKFGAGRSILIDRNNRIIAGNKTIENAEAIGLEDIIIVETTGDKIVAVKRTDLDLDTPEARELALADNQTAMANIDWDFEVLTEEVSPETLEDWGIEVPDTAEAEEDNYQIPDEIETDIVLGDLIEIGRHRLLCGDSTNADDVANLLDGGNPILMVTDPPYGVNYNANWRNEAERADGTPIGASAIMKVNNDDRHDWTESYSLFTGDVVYVWHRGRNAGLVHQNLNDAGFELVAQIIWAKNNIVIGRGDYHFKHEPCWYAVRKGKKHNWQGSRKQHSVWDIDKPLKSETGHSTQKPVECMSRPIKNNTYEKESVYDPFIGSGTTMVACQQLNRLCYGMEIDPKYCQVIIDRMQKLDSALTVKINGMDYQPKETEIVAVSVN